MKVKKPFFLLMSLLLFLVVILLTRHFFVILITCVFLAYIIRPLYLIIRAVIKNKPVSALISEFLFFTVLIFVVIFSVNSLFSQLVKFSSPLLAENLINFENETFLNTSLIDFENPLTKETFFSIGGGLQDFAVRTPLLLLNVFLITYVTYYFIKSGDSIYKTIIKMIPSTSSKRVKRFVKRVDTLTKEIIYGYFLTAFFITLLTFVLFTILGINYSVDFSIISGIASLIPVVGNWIIPLILSIYYLMENNYLFPIIFVTFAILTSYLITMIRPIISRKQYTIHPILFILGVIVGFYSLGFFGFLFGPIIFGIFQIGFEEVFKKGLF